MKNVFVRMGINNYSSTFILAFSVCETTSRAAFHRWKGCILPIACNGHFAVQHITTASNFLFLWRFDRFQVHRQGFMIPLTGHTTLGKTPLDERSASRRDRYLTTHTFTTARHPCRRRDSNPQSK